MDKWDQAVPEGAAKDQAAKRFKPLDPTVIARTNRAIEQMKRAGGNDVPTQGRLR
jgi:hypothetical protein